MAAGIRSGLSGGSTSRVSPSSQYRRKGRHRHPTAGATYTNNDWAPPSPYRGDYIDGDDDEGEMLGEEDVATSGTARLDSNRGSQFGYRDNSYHHHQRRRRKPDDDPLYGFPSSRAHWEPHLGSTKLADDTRTPYYERPHAAEFNLTPRQYARSRSTPTIDRLLPTNSLYPSERTSHYRLNDDDDDARPEVDRSTRRNRSEVALLGNNYRQRRSALAICLTNERFTRCVLCLFICACICARVYVHAYVCVCVCVCV